MKACTGCGEVKELTEFRRHRRASDGRDQRCKVCRRAEAKLYRQENPEIERARVRRWVAANREHVNESHRRYRAENPGKATAWSRRWRYGNAAARAIRAARKRIDEASIAMAEIVLGDPCSYCDGPADTVDHIDSLHVGGPNHWSNFTGACRRCNGAKRERPLLEYLLYRLETP